MTLPRLHRTVMCPTFRAPVSRPGADTRRETWGAETEDGVWLLERQESERYCKWALIHKPTDTLVTYTPSLKSAVRQIAAGSWTYREADPTDGLWRELAMCGAPHPTAEFYRKRDGRKEGPPCVVAMWYRGTELHRGVFGAVPDAIAWAQAGIAATREAA